MQHHTKCSPPVCGITAAVLLAIAVAAMPAVSFAQATRPADRALAPGASSTDSMPIAKPALAKPRTAGADADGATTNATAAAAASRNSLTVDMSKLGLAFAIVLGLIFLARWLVGRTFAGSRAPAASRVVKVLSRTPLAPRQQVMLLQVGRRVIVVGDSNGSLTTLANLDDADEVAMLVGQLQQEQIVRASSFGGLFGRAERKFQEEAAGDGSSPPHADPREEAHVRSELSGLVEKVRSIRSQMGSD